MAIDEVQRAPELIVAVKAAVDEDRRPGRFVLTGSANLLDLPGTHESLAGRAETIDLFGFSEGELRGQLDDFLGLVSGGLSDLASLRSDLDRADYLQIACSGAYPEALTRAPARRGRWFSNYLDRVANHDAGEISRLAHLAEMSTLLEIVAANTSGELVHTKVASQTSIPANAVGRYLALLERLYLIHALPSWGRSLNHRIVGRPKTSLIDTGLAAYVMNVSADALAHQLVSDQAGRLLESFVVSELRRQQSWATLPSRLFHYRDRDGREVDIVAENGHSEVIGIEVKATRSVQQKHFAGLRYLRDSLGPQFNCGVLLHTGPSALSFGDRLYALPISALWAS